MQVALLTVGDELLAGDIADTNAAWLAARLAERGVSVREILTLPDTVEVIASRLGDLAERSDAVIVTGGVGGTPDDVTMDAIAAAFDAPLTTHPEARAGVERTLSKYDGDVEVDIDAWSALPEGSQAIPNEAGLSPGCRIESVYVLPGIPEEMKAMFGEIADAFDGDRVVRTIRSAEPESALVADLDRAIERFDVSVGSYPEGDGEEKRITVRGDSVEAVEAAIAWLDERV
ncbi:molybdopterin-binding protein [Saliphagus sp. LR7]|uniref:competence/damage-inducible protein A n=1 Tax=Saliphagus sp. LR7 TaxID=2282654 RepID=UPI000DF7B046|nr:molybdopterin-binding protein [Saliphagus sp. LR7]